MTEKESENRKGKHSHRIETRTAEMAILTPLRSIGMVQTGSQCLTRRVSVTAGLKPEIFSLTSVLPLRDLGNRNNLFCALFETLVRPQVEVCHIRVVFAFDPPL